MFYESGRGRGEEPMKLIQGVLIELLIIVVIYIQFIP